MALRIEINPNVLRKGMWDIRIGDIEGNTACTAMSQDEVLDFIKERMDMNESLKDMIPVSKIKMHMDDLNMKHNNPEALHMLGRRLGL